MKKLKKAMTIAVVIIAMALVPLLTGCEPPPTDYSYEDIKKTLGVGDKLAQNQPTPDDIEYSLERYNLIKRAYWVNGMREKALSLPTPLNRPLGYCVLISHGSAVARFVVDGKVTSLNSFLTPDTTKGGTWLPDVDGSYGQNDAGVFFFTTDGKYVEWLGDYLYSDIPFQIDNPVIRVEGGK